MSVETIARRYSTALADVVAANGESVEVSSELALLGDIFSKNAELKAVFGNPSINHGNKEKVLEQLIARTKPLKTTANFLRVLLRNGRLTELADINERFEAVLEERSGTISAVIVSARDLPHGERAAFQKNLEHLTGKRVKIEYSVDENIIGGVVTRIGSTVYDGSVRTKLDNLREQLVNGL